MGPCVKLMNRKMGYSASGLVSIFYISACQYFVIDTAQSVFVDHGIVCYMDEGTLKTPIPKCRLYWSLFFGVCCSNFVGSESGQKQSVRLENTNMTDCVFCL
jgi:hypothetical protein